MDKISIKSLSQQPIVIVSMLIGFLWAFNDLSTRVLSEKNYSTQSSIDNSIVDVPTMVLSSRDKKFIEEQYKHFIIQDEKTKDLSSEQLTLEQQLKQQGLLKDVFVKDYKLTLKAVITEQKGATANGSVLAYALINKTHVSTGETELVKILNGQLIEGFLISILTSTQVELKRTHSQGEQNIILTMYRVATNSKE